MAVTHISSNPYSTTMQGDRLMDSAQAAPYLNICRKTLLRYTKDGLIPYVRYRGKYQYRKSALDYFISRNEVKGRHKG